MATPKNIVINIAGAPTVRAVTAGGTMNGDAYETATSGNVVWTTGLGPPTKLVVTTSGQSIPTDSCSGVITVELQDEAGTAVVPGVARTLILTTSSTAATYYSDSGCTSAISSISLGAASTSVSVYYKNVTTTGTFGMTIDETPSVGLTAATQNITITASTAAVKLLLTGPGTVTTATCSGPFTATSANSSDVPTNVTADTTVNLTSAGKATFYTAAGCGTATSSVVISNGTNNKTFYYIHGSGIMKLCKHRKSSTGKHPFTISGANYEMCVDTTSF